ncbi:MAG TPA: hypothetical protein V6C78_31650 [Crinalium sp.]|jgi:hypothetical protein
MITHFITAELDLPDSPDRLQQAIATTLNKHGEPLRWAITTIDTARKKVQIEAVVTTEREFLPSVVVPVTSV